MKLVGIDGCKYGWVAACLDGDMWTIEKFRSVESLTNQFGLHSQYLIDVPLGLPSRGIERTCESEARKVLAKRASSVFDVPMREAIELSREKWLAHKEHYRCANQIQVENNRSRFSLQSWCIAPKIKEANDFLISEERYRSPVFREGHPEVAFKFLASSETEFTKKKSKEGKEQRIRTLERYSPGVGLAIRRALENSLRKDFASDDVVDAICLALVLKLREEHNVHIDEDRISSHPGSHDQFGIEMAIYYFDAARL